MTKQWLRQHPVHHPQLPISRAAPAARNEQRLVRSAQPVAQGRFGEAMPATGLRQRKIAYGK
ncbi:MAG: hypothetical protein M3372_03040 [Verrucomicrobiota bacterium]|nr:hypothetical protein [Verrucomicrobiota bacterium]